MSHTMLLIILLIAGIIWLFIYLRSTTAKKLPPGPPGLPIIGHLHILRKLPHRTLYNLSQTYGPIMSLRLGSIPAIIVSSPAAAELFLKTHDTVFASRPKSQGAHILNYGTKGVAFTEYGTYWRNVRKFCTLQLLSASKIDSMAGLRRAELDLLVETLKGAAGAREVVDVSEKGAHLIANITCGMLFGKTRDERFDLTGVIHEMAQVLGEFNIADFVPFLGAFDLRVTSKAVDKIFEIIIDEHEQDANIHDRKLDRDFVDILLSLKASPKNTHEQLSNAIDRSHIKAILVDMIIGGVDTTETAIEWIMSELIRHPRVMKLVQQEIKNVLVDGAYVEESHLSKLEYLDMVIKESIRLYPVAPLLVPRESMDEIVIDGYYIPKGSRLMVNIWGIGHDPKIWSENVKEFFPERFIGSHINFGGQNCYELIPFGSGRRGCPGMHLGLRNVKLVVAQLVHTFDWELPFGMTPNELDMTESFGLPMPRAKHLLAIPSLR